MWSQARCHLNPVAELNSLAFYTGYERCVLVTHDWGGVVASHFTSIYPEMVEKLILINIPHLTAFLRHLRQSWGQTRKSWWDWGCWSLGVKHDLAPGNRYLSTSRLRQMVAILQILFWNVFLFENWCTFIQISLQFARVRIINNQQWFR